MDHHSRSSPRLFFEDEEPAGKSGNPAPARSQKVSRKKIQKAARIPAKESPFSVPSEMQQSDRPVQISSSAAVVDDTFTTRPKIKEAGKKADQKRQNRICFEEQKPKSPSKLRHIESVAEQVRAEIRQHITESNEDENSVVNAVLNGEQVVNKAAYESEHAYRAHKLRQERKLIRAAQNDKPASAPHITLSQSTDHQGFSSNPLSRWQQKRAIRKENAAAKAGMGTSYQQTAKAAGQAARNTGEKAKDIIESLRKRPKGFLVFLLLAILLMMVSVLQSCTPLTQGILQALVIGTYPAEELEVLAAEQAYAAKEALLRDELEHYAEYHPEFDSCVVNMDDIGHDPYVLIAIISAYLNGEEWTLEQALPVIDLFFNAQYKVTTSVRTETVMENGSPGEVHICTVTLESENLSHLPVYTMSKQQLGLYALYMATHGNMEGIFAGYPGATPLRDPELYDIPQETLDANPSFARLMEEAQKYIGYPYVWGGSSPDTSFDCAGFVCWVYSASGVSHLSGLGATGLHTACREVSASEVRPGDLVFFEGTMGESVAGITHVGIYVGNNRMLHCGSPIGFADLTDSYWQQHFHSYGRVP